MAVKALNFRSTSGYVTDDASETYCLSSDSYPTTRNGMTFGISGGIVTGAADRDSGLDRRLAGILFKNNGGAAPFTVRIDLDSSGGKTIRVALGDAGSTQPYQYIEIKDDASSLFAIDDSDGTATANFDDANATNHTAANWPGSNTSQDVTFSSTIMNVLVGTPDAQSGFTTLAHVFVDDAAPPGGLDQIGLFAADLRPESWFSPLLVVESWFDEELVTEGAPTLVIQNAAHAHTAQNLILTQTHVLAVNNAAHAHTAENLTLTQVHTLAIQNAAHGHTSGSPTLTVEHNLIVQNATHGHTGENVVVDTPGTLGIHNGAHALTSDNLSLTQVHTLAIANAAHAHTAGSPTLTEVHDLTIQSALHSHSAANLALTQVHVLAISNAAHDHTAQNLGLGSSGDLIINDSFHEHTARNISFAWTMPADVLTVSAEGRLLTVGAEARQLVVASEDRTHNV